MNHPSPHIKTSSTKACDAASWEQCYEEAAASAAEGRREEALAAYAQLLATTQQANRQARLSNDRAVLLAAGDDISGARTALQAALRLDPGCQLAVENLRCLDAAETSNDVPFGDDRSDDSQCQTPSEPPIRIAVLSFLFNWPSSGGGIIHTIELVNFLAQAGYAVQHVVARKLDWGIGRIEDALPHQPVVLDFDEKSWNRRDIQTRFREAVAHWDPDCVIITDSWNMKPVLAEAVGDRPYFLRLQATECLCPLNNLRLLPGGERCSNHQLAHAARCCQCLQRLGAGSGGLHQAERALAGVGTEEYDHTLRRAFAEAEAVLVVEPLAEALLGPYCRRIEVIPSGFDGGRFPWPWPQEPPRLSGKLAVLMAGVVEDPIKGFQVLHKACQNLWQRRQDFELIATGNPAGDVDDRTRFVGWQSQQDLPRYLRAADVVVLPPLGPEALGRTAIEAMAVGRPVLASRVGGLPYSVADGAGLLFEPGDAEDLSRQLERLLDDADLRATLGLCGRRRFEQHYTWQHIIDRHYRPLLAGVAAPRQQPTT